MPRPKKYNVVKVKLPYVIPEFYREMISKIAERQGMNATEALIAMVDEAYEEIMKEGEKDD